VGVSSTWTGALLDWAEGSIDGTLVGLSIGDNDCNIDGRVKGSKEGDSCGTALGDTKSGAALGSSVGGVDGARVMLGEAEATLGDSVGVGEEAIVVTAVGAKVVDITGLAVLVTL
jgi:hypothetical protein